MSKYKLIKIESICVSTFLVRKRIWGLWWTIRRNPVGKYVYVHESEQEAMDTILRDAGVKIEKIATDNLESQLYL